MRPACVGFCLLCLVGCGGAGVRTVPLVAGEKGGADSAPFNFDDGLFAGPAFIRTDDPALQAIDAVASGLRNLSVVGTGLDAYNPASRGASALDSFIFLPTRGHRAATAELLDEEVDGARVTGTIQYDPAAPAVGRTLDLRATGEGVDLHLVAVSRADGSFLILLSGTDHDITGQAVQVQVELTGRLDGGEATGRNRTEILLPDGRPFYLADYEFSGPLDGSTEGLDGQNVWVDPDGYWMHSVWALDLAAGGASGSVTSHASDCTLFHLSLGEDGSGGEILSPEHEPLGQLVPDEEGRLRLVDQEGRPFLDEDGEPLVFALPVG